MILKIMMNMKKATMMKKIMNSKFNNNMKKMKVIMKKNMKNHKL